MFLLVGRQGGGVGERGVATLALPGLFARVNPVVMENIAINYIIIYTH